MRRLITLIKKLQQQPALNNWLLFALLVVLFIPHWIHFYRNIDNSICPDLLLRTIGSRLQEAGKPIYEYKWKIGDPVGWLNPYEDSRVGVNGVVATPFALWLFQPLANLSYCDIRIIWSCTQELLLFITMLLCCFSFRQRLAQVIFVIVAVLFFVYSRNWLLNVYNGQMYIMYAFVFALSGYFVTKSKNGVIPVALFPFFSPIRPFFITALVPFLKMRKGVLACFAASATLAVIIVFSTTTTGKWKQYNHAMKLYAKEQTGELAMDTVHGQSYWNYADGCTKDRRPAFTVFGAGDLFSLQHYLYLLGLPVSNLLVFQLILAAALLIVLFIGYTKGWLQDLPKQLLLSFLCYQLCELITPASRNPYNMIQWLPAVSWLIAFGNIRVLLLVVVGLCLNHDLPFWFKYEREIGESLLFVALILFLLSKRSTNERPAVL